VTSVVADRSRWPADIVGQDTAQSAYALRSVSVLWS